MRIIVIFTLVLVTSLTSAQSRQGHEGRGPGQAKGTISGKITDDSNGSPLEYTTVALYSFKDSSLITGTITDETGAFKMEASYGRYFLKLEFLSYKPKTITNIIVSGKKPEADIGTLGLQLSSEMLKEIEVSAEKGQVQVGLDKKVFNVAKDLSSIGGTAQDALQNIPSVDVDMDGSVSLRGSSNVRILIDGKPSGLTGISSADALEQIPANTIESIEVITNPSVKYDAEGMAGIINIILKKNKKKGLNGLLTLTAGWPQNHTGTLNLNYGTPKVNLFGSYSVRYRERPGLSISHRETTLNDTITYLDQDGQFVRTRFTHTGRVGLDLMPDNKNTITASLMVRSTTGKNTRETEYQYSDFNRILTSVDNRSSLQNRTDLNLDYSLNYRKRFKKKRQLFTAAAQYSTGYEENDENITQQAYTLEFTSDGSMPLLQRSFSKESQNTLLLQADYTHPIAKGKLETGYKSIIKNIDKDYDLEEYNDSTSNWDYLTGLSNQFLYDEQVHAGYAMFSSKVKKFSYQLGLRAEQTYVTSRLVETNEEFKKNYLNFFPSIHLSQELKGDNKLQLSYSRRIRRPRFWTLNPFWSFSDPLNWWVGNPDLNPELTHSFEFGNMKYWQKSTVTASIYYRHTDGVIQRIRTLDSTGVSITKPQNLSSQESFGLEVTYSITPFKWWRFNGSFNYFRRIIDGGNIGEGYATDFYSWTGRINNNLTLWKKINLQVMFNYRAPRETTQGKRREMYFMDIGLKKDIMSKKGNISFRVSDVFNSRKYVTDTYGDNYYINSTYKHGIRTYYLSFTYKINKYKPKRQRQDSDYEMEGEMQF